MYASSLHSPGGVVPPPGAALADKQAPRFVRSRSVSAQMPYWSRCEASHAEYCSAALAVEAGLKQKGTLACVI